MHNKSMTKTQNRPVKIKSDSAIKVRQGNHAVSHVCVEAYVCVSVNQVLVYLSVRIIPLINFIIWIPIRTQMSGLKSSCSDYSTYVWAGTESVHVLKGRKK